MSSSALVFQSTEIQGSHAPQVWQHWMDTLYGLESDVYGDSQFAARLGTFEMGPVSLTKIESSRHRVRRTSSAMAEHQTDCLKIVAPWRGSALVEQGGRQARVQAGQWMIYDTTQEYALDTPEWCEHLIVTLPKSRFAAHARALEGLMARFVGGHSGVSRIALDMMRSTFTEGQHMTERLAHHVAEHLVQLIGLSLLDACGKATLLSPSELLRGRIKAHVRQHLRDAHLTVDAIAEALNCSKRHLYNAFAEEPLSISQFIWQERLALFQREVQLPSQQHCTITELALACGFANGAHFSRLFKQAMGITPAQYRAELVLHA